MRESTRTWSARLRRGLLLLALGLTILSTGCAAPFPQIVQAGWNHEQQAIPFHDPAPLPPAPIPNVPPPITVADTEIKKEEWHLSLNEAIRITLENARAIRVYTGLGATNSGRSIYDAAIATTAIDQRQAKFDPTLTASQNRLRTESPGLESLGSGFAIGSTAVDIDRSAISLNKVNALGGQTGVSLVRDRSAFNRDVIGLNPDERTGLEFNFTQPLLLGGGFQFNQSAIVLARLDTERSYFQFKDATQDLVRGTIEAYWNLVLARLEVWAREIQYDVATEAYEREKARRKENIANVRDAAQSQVTFEQFRASLIAARAAVLAREGALRNILGLPTTDNRFIVPVSAPASERFQPDWEALLRFAEQRRPDIIELKLVLEADRQRKIQAENLALPQVDLSGLYRWNGLSGRLPRSGARITGDMSQYTDWTVGINFSVPLGLREGRARVREQDLIILRDQANLEQGLHAMSHDLAITVRELASSYEQYLAYREARAAALTNLQVQDGRNKAKLDTLYLNVLQALNDWGSIVTAEARALIDYNILLTNLERQTGTILETHGLVFLEERFQAAGPLLLPGHEREYPRDLQPKGEPTVFKGTDQPGENAFDLTRPVERPARLMGPVPSELPRPRVSKFAEDKAK